MMRRRQFLLGTLGMLGLGAAGMFALGPRAAAAEVAAQVRRRLGFLRLDEPGLQAFAHDQVAALLAKRPTWNRLKYHFLAVFSKSFTRYERSSDRRSRLERLQDNFAATYLLSSDFFIKGADPSRLVRYLGFYDPLHACSNPFARPVIDTPSASSAGTTNAAGGRAAPVPSQHEPA